MCPDAAVWILELHRSNQVRFELVVDLRRVNVHVCDWHHNTVVRGAASQKCSDRRWLLQLWSCQWWSSNRIGDILSHWNYPESISKLWYVKLGELDVDVVDVVADLFALLSEAHESSSFLLVLQVCPHAIPRQKSDHLLDANHYWESPLHDLRYHRK